MNAPKTGPTFKARYGAVSVTCWENKFTVQGKEIVNFNVKVSRSYKDRDNKWVETSGLRQNDLPKAIEGLKDAYRWLCRSDKENRVKSDSQQPDDDRDLAESFL